MQVFKQHIELTEWLNHSKALNQTIGFVPTMGALHEGHIALVKQALNQNTLVVASVFINPKQFNNISDYEKYPVTEQADITMLEKAGCHAVYIPSVEDIYPTTAVHIPLNIAQLESILEGPNRPGHFDGVVQVVHRLFSIVQPDNAYFGLKDFQQCKVIQALCKAYFPDIHLEFCPTLREVSGLAKSSRNMRLTDKGRMKAALLYKALKMVAADCYRIPVQEALKEAGQYLAEQGINVEYLSCANSETFELTDDWQPNGQNIVLIAAYVEHIRLIDNLQF